MSLKPWFQKAEQQISQQELARMTRQQAFDRGLLTVHDLDDEELRAGKCRNPDGKIPRIDGKTEPIPRDLYDEMVAEHEARFNQRLRERLDTMIDVMVGVATDETVEPRDRLDAAKYIFERVAGKTPDRVHVVTTKAPWEEMMAGIANITRQQSQALRQQGVIDAEVVEGSVLQDSAGMDGQIHADVGMEGDECTTAAPMDVQTGTSSDHMVQTSHGSNKPDLTQTANTVPPEYFEPQPQYAPPVESHDMPGNSSATMPPGNSSATMPPPNYKPPPAKPLTVQEMLAQQEDLARRRQEAKERIKLAKKRRIVRRTIGADVWQDINIEATEHPIEGTDEIKVRFDLT